MNYENLSTEDKGVSQYTPEEWDNTHKQNGGIATTPQQQHIGLNNPNYDSMTFPGSGQRTFRGLDNHMPVMITDETGKQQTLTGPNHLSKFTGEVHEKRRQIGGSIR